MLYETCKFVRKSELLAGISPAIIEDIEAGLTDDYTWGNANRTMISIQDFLEYSAGIPLLEERLQSLSDQKVDYVDLEN